MPAWEDVAAMKACRIAGAHRGALHKLLDWNDEASLVHWNQEARPICTSLEAHTVSAEVGA
jgi:hypothetical protein